MQSPIADYCIKVSIGGHYELKLVTKLLLQVFIRKLHNIMVSPLKEGGIRQARDTNNNIIIRDYTLYTILPPPLKKMDAR